MDPLPPGTRSLVRRRCVYYVSGFDPKGAAHYHALYKEQAALQAQAGGLAVEVGPRQRQPSGNAAWTVRAEDAGTPVETWYEFLRWDDIVRAHWPRHQWQLWRDILVTSLFNLRHGSWWRMFRQCWPPAVALGLPFVLMLAVLLGVPALSALAGWLAHRGGGSLVLALGAATVVAAGLLLAARKLEARFSMYWLMRSYAFTRLQSLDRAPALEERLDAHATQLARRLAEGQDDEVLVVGHSSGAIMACAIVARAMRQSAGRHPAKLSLLTLGHCLPLLGTLPQARSFRQELAELARADALDWIDFSAPPDGCSFALADPMEGCGIDVPGRLPDRPKLLSPRFAEMFDANTYHALRPDKFRIHFQYLMASQRPVDYDFFRITGGAMTLAQRFAGHASVTDYRALRPLSSLQHNRPQGGV